MDFQKIIAEFGIEGTVESASPFGSGHINDTMKIMVNKDGEKKGYILQRLNTTVFPDPDILMENGFKVVKHLKNIIEKRGGDPERETLRFYRTVDGKSYYQDEEGNCWRLEDLIEHTRSYDLCTSEAQFESTGYAFGSFMADLADFPADELGEVIKNFHNTKVRFATFESEVEANRSGRADTCQDEIAFALARKDLAECLVKQLDEGLLPLRVTHNDTKINNILMDDETDQPICIVDLDTVMPGACAYDFGDSIRFGASSAEEDEKDLSKVFMRLDLFEAYTRGYMKAVGNTLTEAEAKSLSIGSIVITFETGIRFLGDYLNGDVYFKTAYPEHNLVRARTQFKLVADMEKKLPQMEEIVDRYYRMAKAE
ncbi:MAG: aminoglycoside phosphotransferase family protein [Firmicutes bacterium]|nr:aminoglycoside phosphotransferase family protein [Bacillota bacterium]